MTSFWFYSVYLRATLMLSAQLRETIFETYFAKLSRER